MRTRLLWISGVGLGVGLAYVLRQERSATRRALPRMIRYTTPRRGIERWIDTGRWAAQRQAQRLLPKPWQRPSSSILPVTSPIRRSHVVTGLVVLGSLVLGAGLMYALDPTVGRQRRARFQQGSTSSWRRMTSTVRKTSQRVGNKTREILSESRQYIRGAETPDDDVLIARVRSQIGHVISHPGAIGVTAHQGRVTLSGPVPADEIDKLLYTVAGVMGVHEVVNQLEVHDQTNGISGLQGNR